MRNRFLVFLGMSCIGLVYVIVMLAIMPALTKLSLINLLLSALLWPLFVTALISIFRRRVWALLLGLPLLLIQSIYLIAHKVYFEYFRSVLHVEVITQNFWEGTATANLVFMHLLKPMDLVALMAAILGAVLITGYVPLQQKAQQSIKFVAAVMTIIGVQWVYLEVRHGTRDQMNRPLNLTRYGVIQALGGQLWEVYRPKKTVPPEPVGRMAVLVNPEQMFPIPEIDHVFVLQLESLDPGVVDLTLNGHWVMPYLRSLRAACSDYKYFYAQHGGGGSSDAELSAFTSLSALPSHGGFLTAERKWIISLPQHLANNGIQSYFFHANKGTYYDRRRVYSKLGFNKIFFASDFQGEAPGWMSKDKAFFDQSFQLLEKENPKDKFMSYLVTIQSHGPFQNHNTEDPFSNLKDEELPAYRHYLWSMAELDHSVEYFFERLKHSKWSQKTAVIMYSDHISQFYDKPHHGQNHIFGMICGIGKIKESEGYLASHIDIAPTINNIFHLNRPNQWLGASLLKPTVSRVAVFPNPPGLVQLGHEPPQPSANQSELQKYTQYSEYIFWP